MNSDAVKLVQQSGERAHFFSLPSFTICSWLGRKVTVCLTWLHKRYSDIATYVTSFFQTQTQPAERPQRTVKPTVRVSGSAANPNLDSTMQKLQNFITTSFTMMGESVYNHLLAPIFQKFLTNPVIDPSSQTAWEAISLKVATVIANEIVQVFDDALSASSGELKLILNWLLGNQSADELTQLLKTVYGDLEQTSPNFIKEFVKWLTDKTWLLSDAAIPAPKLAAPEADSSLLLKLLVTTIQKLIDTKVRAFLQIIALIVKTEIAPTVEKTIVDNSTIVGDILGRRLAALIQATAPLNPPDSSQPTVYQQSYDQIITLLFNQVNAISQAAKSGDSAALLKAFSSSDACDPRIRSLLNPPADVVDQAAYKSQLEMAISFQTAKRLISLLLPDQKSSVGGFTITTPGIVLLLRELELPIPLLEAFKAFVTWPEGLFPDGPPASVDMLYQAVVYFLEKAVASIIDDQLQTGLTTGLQLGMNYVVPPAYLNMWMVRGAFPASFVALVQGLMANTLQNPTNDTVEAFMPLAAKDSDRKAAYQKLAPKLYISVCRACTGIDLAAEGWDQAKFIERMAPFLDEIADNLVEQANGTAPSSAQVKDWIVQYTKPADRGSNDAYGNLLVDLMFNIGNFSLLNSQSLGRGLVQLFLKGLISRDLTSVLDPLRENEQLFVSGVLQGLGQVAGTQAQIDNILWAPMSPSQDVSAQLTESLDQTASLIDSLARQSVGMMANNASFYTSAFKGVSASVIRRLLPSHDNFTATLTKVYSTVLGNREMNMNLYIQLINTILTGMENVQATTAIPFP